MLPTRRRASSRPNSTSIADTASSIACDVDGLDAHRPFAASVIQEPGINPPAHGLERLWVQRPGDRAGEVVILPHEHGQAVPRDLPDRRLRGAGPPLEIDRELVV